MRLIDDTTGSAARLLLFFGLAMWTLPAGANAQSAAEAEARDRAALIALYEATDGPNWSGTCGLNWNTDLPLSAWNGVRWSEYYGEEEERTGVDRVFLSSCGLTGEIPIEIGNLAKLGRLQLYENQLTGGIPASLGNLPRLWELYLAGNRLSGPIPASLGNMWNLSYLWLDDDTGLCLAPDFPMDSRFAHLAQGQDVGPCHAPSFVDRDPLRAFYDATDGPNWRYTTNWNSSEPLETWFGVSTRADGRVAKLLLYWNRLRGELPPAVGELAYLTHLNISDSLSTFQGRRVRRQLTGEIPGAVLGRLARLTSLELYGNAFSGGIPAALGNLANLERLDLTGSQLSGPIPAALGNLANLRELWLYLNRLSGPIPAELGNLTNLSKAYLDRNQLSGPIPAALGDLTNLTLLWLQQNQLSGPIPAALGNLTSLTDLQLQDNQLSGPIPAALGDLTNLTGAYLARNQLSGPIPAALGNLMNLRSLDLNQNQLSGPIPAALGNLTNLHTLYLHRNQLSGPIPAALGDLNLVNLWVDDDTGLCLGAGFPLNSRFAREARWQGIQICDGVPFTDDPLVARVTPVKGVHFTELRWRIDRLRVRLGLYRFSWRQTLLAGVTPIRAVHLWELRAALWEAYRFAGQTPGFDTARPQPGGAIRAADLNELRRAVEALE